MSAKYLDCASCYFNNRAPEVCEGCNRADQFQPLEEPILDDDIEALDEFTPQEIL